MKKRDYIKKFGEEAWLNKLKKDREYWYPLRIKKRREKSEKERESQRECQKTYKKEYENTKAGRAKHLIRNYNLLDKKKGLENNLTYEWIIENIFNSKCIYCGETDWHKLGCDRIDNKKAHTTDNCVCACFKCNTKRGHKYSVEEFKEIIKKL